jgi:hypothetical protein
MGLWHVKAPIMQAVYEPAQRSAPPVLVLCEHEGDEMAKVQRL